MTRLILLAIFHENMDIDYSISKMVKFPSVDHATDEKSFSILFCLPLNINQTYTHGKKLGNTSYVTRVNFGLKFSYNLNMY